MSEEKKPIAIFWPSNGDPVDKAMNICCHQCRTPLTSMHPGLCFQAYGLSLCVGCLVDLLQLVLKEP